MSLLRRMVALGLVALVGVTPLAAQWTADLAVCREPPPANQHAGPIKAVYVPMRDGVRIALDVVLPDPLPAGGKVPTILTMTRYWRAREGTGLDAMETLYTSHGYAVVSGDSRGTGASSGTWLHPRQPGEVKDFGEVVDWIAAQPWSDGNVGATGTSYAANTSDWVAWNERAAIKAIVPRFPDFDPYTDLYFPGGIFHHAFGKGWSDGVRAQDLNQKITGRDGVPRGIKPVDGPDGARQLQEALQQRAKLPGYYDGLVQVTYRDDRPDIWGDAFDDFSIQNQRAVLERSKVPMYTWAGWFDAGTQAGVLRRFMSWSNPQRAIVGPWSHGARFHASPFLPPDTPTTPDNATQDAESVCYFDRYLKRAPYSFPAKQLIYYTVGEEKWKTTAAWPPAGSTPTRWYFAANATLTSAAPTDAVGTDQYQVSFETTTGLTNRWQTQNGANDVVYPDRADTDRGLLTYTSAPLESDLEITGYPVVHLALSSTATDGAVFAYLEDVEPSGKVVYVTEGQLRALHRKVSADAHLFTEPTPYHSYRRKDGTPLEPGQITELNFGLFPTSVLFRRGHRIRIAIAGADKDTFVRVPAEGPAPLLTVHRSSAHRSSIELPVMRRP